MDQPKSLTPFQQLSEACDLYQKGRVNTAAALWKELPKQFRIAMLKYVATLYNAADLDILRLPRIVLESPFGEFQLNPHVALLWMDVVPELANG